MLSLAEWDAVTAAARGSAEEARPTLAFALAAGRSAAEQRERGGTAADYAAAVPRLRLPPTRPIQRAQVASSAWRSIGLLA